MKVDIIGRGLIGGSFEKAARRAGHEARIHPGRGPSPDVSGGDIVVVATPLSAIVPAVEALAAGGTLRRGAVVVDIAGVKTPVCNALAKFTDCGWCFIGGHPMAGKEKTGYANSCEDLFDGASMILTPFENTPPAAKKKLSDFLSTLGFSRIVESGPGRHDRMISFTSQLCHLISSAYVRDPLAREHEGFSAGSFRDMARVGAPDPDVWTELFLANRGELARTLERFTGRMEAFKDALERGDGAAIHAMLEEGAAAMETKGGAQ